MRIFIPVSQAMLRTLVRDGALPGPLDACAVTDALRAWYPEGDDEDLEFAAQSRAADLCLPLIVDDVPLRRLVLAADTLVERAPAVDELVGVRAISGLTLDTVVALFADSPEAEPALRAALAALASSAADVPPEVEVLDDHELAWFAPEELGPILSRSTSS
jgi:hypothetical protein